jgi:hypothetical protein
LREADLAVCLARERLAAVAGQQMHRPARQHTPAEH